MTYPAPDPATAYPHDDLVTVIMEAARPFETDTQIDIAVAQRIATALLGLANPFPERPLRMFRGLTHGYLTEDDVRATLREQMAAVGGLVKWAKAHEIPISRVSEFQTGRRPASLTILIALGLTRTIVPASSIRLDRASDD